ncbi:MAG: hypothetical protein JHD02_03630 [Thermoleophilaceae bacterium]|nr:hypothetical protein [Thermoleophilaceae bacterium]
MTIAQSDRLYVDTTVFINLGKQGSLLTLIKYLGDRARIVNEVDVEIQRNSTLEDFRFLGTLAMIRDWPPVAPVELTTEQMIEVFSIKDAIARPGDHPQKDLGEIASVIAAKADGMVPVISDDGTAAMLCSVRGIDRLTTPDVLEEMRAAGVLDS